MCRNMIRPLVMCLFSSLAALGMTSTVHARSFWDCLTGKNPPPASTCNSPGGKCGTTPATGAAAPGSTQPYMVPIGPPRYVPAAPGAQPGAPSLSPSGVSLPSSDPAFVSRPVWPTTPAASYAAPAASQATYYQQPAAAPAAVSSVPASSYPGAPCPTCQQSVGVNYAPYTAYRDKMVQVPTTVYRPVTGVDPRTGAAVTVLQPCITTTWQVQKVPAPLSRSFARAYRPLPVSSKPTPMVVAPAMVVAPSMVSQPTFAATAAPPMAWGANIPTAPATTGYVPYTTIPSAVSPYSTVPAAGYAAPGTGAVRPIVPATPGATPAPASDPADLAPSLNPGSSGGGAVRSNSGASFRPSFPKAPLDSSNLRGLPEPPPTNPSKSEDADGDLRPVPPSGFPVRPIPTPESESSRDLQDRVPALIQPAENRTALNAPDRSLTASISAGSVPANSARAQTARRWDDGGWRGAP